MDNFFASIGYGNFLIVLGILIFVHELGHYLVARWCGVRVDVFSIGFGPEIFGITDRRGTRWKVSVFPIGGYVKMFGEGNAATEETQRQSRALSAEERAVSFAHKSVGQRSAVVAAGPLANFLFAIVAFAALFVVMGKPVAPDFREVGIGSVIEGSAADAAGLQTGDRILRANNKDIKTFSDLIAVVNESAGMPISFTIVRRGERLGLDVAPRLVEVENEAGERSKVYRLGVGAPSVQYESVGVIPAVGLAVEQTWRVTVLIVEEVGKLVSGRGDIDSMGGPVKIAQYSKETGERGAVSIVGFMALLSINLGLLNLFPIPVLDGGHLVFYAFEVVRGRPVSARIQDLCLRAGLTLLLTLMVVFTVNDLLNISW